MFKQKNPKANLDKDIVESALEFFFLCEQWTDYQTENSEVHQMGETRGWLAHFEH